MANRDIGKTPDLTSQPYVQLKDNKRLKKPVEQTSNHDTARQRQTEAYQINQQTLRDQSIDVQRVTPDNSSQIIARAQQAFTLQAERQRIQDTRVLARQRENYQTKIDAKRVYYQEQALFFEQEHQKLAADRQRFERLSNEILGKSERYIQAGENIISVLDTIENTHKKSGETSLKCDDVRKNLEIVQEFSRIHTKRVDIDKDISEKVSDFCKQIHLLREEILGTSIYNPINNGTHHIFSREDQQLEHIKKIIEREKKVTDGIRNTHWNEYGKILNKSLFSLAKLEKIYKWLDEQDERV